MLKVRTGRQFFRHETPFFVARVRYSGRRELILIPLKNFRWDSPFPRTGCALQRHSENNKAQQALSNFLDEVWWRKQSPEALVYRFDGKYSLTEGRPSTRPAIMA